MAVLKYPVPAAELRAAVLAGARAVRGAVVRASRFRQPRRHHIRRRPKSLRPRRRRRRATPDRPPRPRSAISSAPISSSTVAASHRCADAARRRRSWPDAHRAARSGNRLDRQRSELAAGHRPGGDDRGDSDLGADRRRAGNGQVAPGRLIHALGPQPDRPFVTVEAIGAGRRTLAASSRRSSSAATANDAPDWSNKLAQAHGGTLYLDEVAALPLELQLHLLRELQFRDYEATAGHPVPPGEVRFLMSTSENLPALIEQGRFRQELYHRISVISLMLPPLAAPRDRHRAPGRIVPSPLCRANSTRTVVGFTRDALDVLQRHDWPGNVRELEAAVQRAVALCNGPRITSSHLAPILNHPRQARAGGGGTPRPAPEDGRPAPQGSPGRTREADHHPGTSGLQLEPPGDRPRARHQSHHALQEDEEV